MRHAHLFFAFITLSFPTFLSTTVAAQSQAEPLQTVSFVELDRYLGTWYEIASIPQRFQKGCVGSFAEYSKRADGDIEVINRCRDKTADGPIREATGKAWVVDATTNAKLKVQFFWPFSGDYWIIDLGPDYQYAVVGHPDRTYLWILSRTPTMDSVTLAMLMERIKTEHGYDVGKINITQVGD